MTDQRQKRIKECQAGQKHTTQIEQKNKQRQTKAKTE